MKIQIPYKKSALLQNYTDKEHYTDTFCNQGVWKSLYFKQTDESNDNLTVEKKTLKRLEPLDFDYKRFVLNYLQISFLIFTTSEQTNFYSPRIHQRTIGFLMISEEGQKLITHLRDIRNKTWRIPNQRYCKDAEAATFIGF